MRSLLVGACCLLLGPVAGVADSARSRPLGSRSSPAPPATVQPPERSQPQPQAARPTPPSPRPPRGDATRHGPWPTARLGPWVLLPHSPWPVVDGVGFSVPATPPPSAPVDPRSVRVGPPTPRASPATAPAPVVIFVERDAASAETGSAIPPPPPAPVNAEGPSRVWFSVLPGDARLRLDDLPIGTGSELGDGALELASGVHVLEARSGDGITERLVFSLEAGQEILIEIDLGAEARDRSRWTDRRSLPQRTADAHP